MHARLAGATRAYGTNRRFDLTLIQSLIIHFRTEGVTLSRSDLFDFILVTILLIRVYMGSDGDIV